MARKGLTRFRLTEAKRVLKRGAGVKSDEGIKAIMELLEEHHYIGVARAATGQLHPGTLPRSG